MEQRRPIIPYTSVFIDAAFQDIRSAIGRCFKTYDTSSEARFIHELRQLFETEQNPNYAIPVYTVRTGFHLYLDFRKFPPGSEVIVSAINIPDMVRLLQFHRLKVIPVDVDLSTLSVDPVDLEVAITDKTVAIVVAHVYGKWMDVTPLIDVARCHSLEFIEDCAEGFHGFSWLGHPNSDVVLFSFGIVKVQTCFLGGIMKIRNQRTFEGLRELYRTYPVQSTTEYLQKLTKYSAIYALLNVPTIIKPGMELTRFINVNHQKHVVNRLRGFPKDPEVHLAKQPCSPLLATMVERIKDFDYCVYAKGQERAKKAAAILESKLPVVGTKAWKNNYWLFPVLVDNPQKTVDDLRQLGVDGYTGSTQLDYIAPTEGSSTRFPFKAKYLIEHVVYLPIHKQVPTEAVNKICQTILRLTSDVPSHRVLCDLGGSSEEVPLNLIKSSNVIKSHL